MPRPLGLLFLAPALLLATAGAAEKPKPLAQSPVLKTAGPLTHALTAPLEGVKELYLVADDGGDGYSHDWAAWVDPVLVTDKGEIPLGELKWTQAESQHGRVNVDRNCEGRPIRVEGRERKGLGMHANSVIRYTLPAGVKSIRVLAALDEGGTGQTANAPTSVRFSIWDRAPGPLDESAGAEFVPADLFHAPDGLEVTLWASSPLLANPTNIDIDSDGRIWVAEGCNYRGSRKRPEGDRIVILEDTDHDGAADKSSVFVTDKGWTAPLGIAVIGNKVVVSMTPNLIVFTDVDGNRVFDPAVDTREVLLTGFDGANHDHSLHSVTVGPDGWWMFNCGNMGGQVTDKSGKTFYLGSGYNRGDIAGKRSDDGHVYVGGTAFRVRPDGTRLTPIGQNFRNSYEQTASSFGDVFQNDNDDPPACRTTWLMEHGNLGFSSFDGKRSWGADKRPGQPTEVAEWRQEDPGVIPAGDVYGGGSPTGIAFVENSALGAAGEGLLLSCEPARNVLFGYHPRPDGAGFELKRSNFLTTNKEEDFAGADFKGGGAGRKLMMLFRPSDVAVGADGAIYVADWFDPRVGGHQTLDPALRGAIYRVAPKGFKPVNPPVNLSTVEGAVAVLKSPAVNVRARGAEALRKAGAAAVPALQALVAGDNAWFRARALFVLADIPGDGVKAARAALAHPDAQTRIAAQRALRRSGVDPVELAVIAAKDASPAVRREALLGLRDTPFAAMKEVLPALASAYDGKDRWFLAAAGIACEGKEAEAYALLKPSAPSPTWSDAFAGLAWRLHPVAAVPDLLARAGAAALPLEARKQAMDGLAFIPDRSAAEAMVELATSGPQDLRDAARWWIQHRNLNDWRPFDAAKLLKAGPKVAAKGFALPPDTKPTTLPDAKALVALNGDAARGKALFHGRALCAACHVMGNQGGDIGPNLTGIGTRFGRDVLVDALVNPSASIALGFEMTVVTRKDGSTAGGLLTGNGDPLLVKAITGEVTAIDQKDVAKVDKAPVSLMPPVNTLGLSAQDVADLATFLQSSR